jgi:CDP-glycerol glycerophosphotransferase (TagB/SpsB family)/glycosyltransferase involved in cell wall biosynthesis
MGNRSLDRQSIMGWTVARFSVIVPAYRVQGYLRECLDSVLAQSFTDVEVIAVDDASPDGCGAIIDEYAARDGRVKAVHLEHNGGLGPARNAGMAAARGDYLLFLDGDDTWTPGTLAAVAERLEQTGDPQVLVYDYARTYWWGLTQRNVMAHVLAAPGPEVFTVAERPRLLDLIMVAWNKAYRRDFITEGGFTFPPGYYEDAAWTFPVMLSAERVACLDRVCVHYRQRRTGSILRTAGRAHFDVLHQYDRVFAFLDTRPDLADWRPLLHRRMAEHCLEVLARPDRIPAADRREFFRLAAARHRRHRPRGRATPGAALSGGAAVAAALSVATPALPGATAALPAAATSTPTTPASERTPRPQPRPPVPVRPLSGRRRRRKAGLKRYLLLRDAFLAFEALRAVNRVRVAARGRARPRLARLARRNALRYYRAQLRRPVDENLAVFSAYWGRGYTCNPAALHAKARELAPHIRGVFLVREDAREHVPPGVETVVVGSRRYWEVMARAKYTFNNVNFEMAIRKREGTVHVQTQHGTPLKLMGVDQHLFPAAARRENFHKLLARADRWDLCLSSNRHSTRVWQRAFPCGYETLEYGYPRNDAFYTATAQDVLEIRERLGVPREATALLYAPTHRDYRHGFDPGLDLERFCAALGPGFTLLLRAHHYYEASPRTWALVDSGRLIDVTAHRSVEEVCLAADALVTDYSSILFDYANLDRPIVLYAEDWEIYRQTRGVYFDLMAQPPGAVARTQEEMAELFRSGAWADERAAAARDRFRKRFCDFDDGRAAERVVRRVLLGEQEVPPVVPLEDRTPAPSPRQALLAAGTA